MEGMVLLNKTFGALDQKLEIAATQITNQGGDMGRTSEVRHWSEGLARMYNIRMYLGQVGTCETCKIV